MPAKVAKKFEHSVTSLSWIPSEAVVGGTRLAFDAGFTHYDPPPPDRIEDLEALRVEDRFRFANLLRAWIEVDDEGRAIDAGYEGGGLMGSTLVRLGMLSYRFQAVALHDIRHDPEYGDGFVRFVQTTGGQDRYPRPASGPPQALRPVASSARVDHALAHDPYRRQGGVRDDRRQSLSHGTGCTTTKVHCS